MRTRRFGCTNEQLPVVGLGTWQMEHDEPGELARTIDAALECGLTHIDTAEMYGGGRVEELLGPLLQGRRDRLFVTSKLLPHNASYEGTLAACERSLRRLRTDHLDLYLLHWPGALPLEETLRAFEELRSRGMIRHAGLSNFDAHELDEAVRLAGPGRLVCNQVLYHLRERAIEHAVLAACKHHDVAPVAYSPLGSGDFPAAEEPDGAGLAEVAREGGFTMRQAALAWLLRNEGLFVIPKTSNPEHARENAAAAELDLDELHAERIGALFPRGPRPAGLPMI